MFKQQKVQVLSLSLVLIMAVVMPGEAEAYYKAAPAGDVAMCVAEVNGQVDTEDADRVRHDVASRKRHSVGYEVEIQTRVYGSRSGDVIREYKSTCFATGGKSPSKFEIEQQEL